MDTLKNILTIIISMSTVIGIFSKILSNIFSKKLKPLEDRMTKNEEKALRDQMNSLRYRIVTFANDLHNGVNHSRYEFEIIFTFIDEYEKLVEELGLHNNYFTEESCTIKEYYRNLNNN